MLSIDTVASCYRGTAFYIWEHLRVIVLLSLVRKEWLRKLSKIAQLALNRLSPFNNP